MKFEILVGAELPETNKGGSPGRTEQQKQAIKNAASDIQNGMRPFKAANNLYANYYRNLNVTDEQRRQRITYLAECIRDYRRGILVLD